MKAFSKEWWIDRAALIAVAIGCAALAWLFSVSAGTHATEILLVVVFAGLILDNRRMRKLLKERSGANGG
ncbi:hypothetical protein G3N59_22500 [Paraburkholderia sp. Ac-20340]|jgi:hypothetical protein|uniref:hypothetical protein n=1 Tax=Paraburkholderia sp. Ac-20340 TaxID=2703888 RepID=UPI00197D76D5|nr:hypothetical protein [Paraburkholderia sp. Ac-20340]MBN3856148.1 hypothetical protein [Paraburkholderia sp. Ac-20340]